jgi:hypothetical protein
MQSFAPEGIYVLTGSINLPLLHALSSIFLVPRPFALARGDELQIRGRPRKERDVGWRRFLAAESHQLDRALLRTKVTCAELCIKFIAIPWRSFEEVDRLSRLLW